MEKQCSRMQNCVLSENPLRSELPTVGSDVVGSENRASFFTSRHGDAWGLGTVMVTIHFKHFAAVTHFIFPKRNTKKKNVK